MCELDAFSSHNLALVVGLLEFEFCHIKLRLILIKQSLASLLNRVVTKLSFHHPFFLPIWLSKLSSSPLPNHMVTRTYRLFS